MQLEIRLRALGGKGRPWLRSRLKSNSKREVAEGTFSGGWTARAPVCCGAFGFGVFECDDIYATYEELKAKGVRFMKEPKEEFYGIEALFADDSGNWFSLGQKKK